VNAGTEDQPTRRRAVPDGTTGPAYDVVVVGGGTAGLSAALTLSRARRSVLVVDAGAPRNAPAGHVHNYLGREGTTPAELSDSGRSEVTGYGGQVVTGTVTSAQRLDRQPSEGPEGPDATGDLAVALADGRAVRARRLLVTTGLVDDLPRVPGLAERWGRDVLHCPYCHGHEVADQPVGVLATGPMAVHTALLWRQWSEDVTLFLHTTGEPSAEQAEQLAARDVAVVAGEVVGLDVTGDRLTGVRLAGGRLVPRRALVVTTRLVARSEVLESLGVHPVEARVGETAIGTRVPAGPTGATAVPGVYVAGNVTDVLAQVVTAAAAGLAVGAAINADLVADDTARAVRSRRDRGETGPGVAGPG
jgi:thioredoxin reductase